MFSLNQLYELNELSKLLPAAFRAGGENVGFFGA